jgi:methylthioribose-1-phosphate isomerase
VSVEPFRLENGRLLLLDQAMLPTEERWRVVEDARAMAEAIAGLSVRGAPAIGIAGALGFALEASRVTESPEAALPLMRRAAATLKAARPTAVNLAHAVDRMAAAAEKDARSSGTAAWIARLWSEAQAIWDEDRRASRAMAEHGASLFATERRFLTHCHTGGLATGGGGTALGVVLELARRGRAVEVWATETRPLLQGARITAWELTRAGVATTLVADAAAPSLLARGVVEAVVVGADRIARNGDVANKIGTYPLALAAREAAIPFVVVAPTTTVDPRAATGAEIPIEERAAAEVLVFQGKRLAPEGCRAANPAFDVTPASLVSAIVTERSVLRGPFDGSTPIDFGAGPG